LPGHIGSCIAGFYLFAAPLISLFTGLDETGMQPRLTAELTKALDSGPQFKFLLLRIIHGKGKFLAEPAEGGSSALTTIVKSNGYTIVPPHTALAKRSEVEVTLFGKQEIASFGV